MFQVPINVIRALVREQNEIPGSQARDEMALPQAIAIQLRSRHP